MATSTGTTAEFPDPPDEEDIVKVKETYQSTSRINKECEKPTTELHL